MNSRRKLAAILFTDMVGYTQQSSLDEIQTLSRRDQVERLIKNSAASNNGRVVKTIGDAVMIEFVSAVEAVTCALNIQDQIAAFNLSNSNTAEDAQAEPLQVRVGVHVGDVVEEDNDLYGNAVNIAQRIQDMAQPGGVCISREVYTQIRPILKLRCDVVTTPSRKPLPEPIEVLTVTNEAQECHNTPISRQDGVTSGMTAVVFSCFVLGWLLTSAVWTMGSWGGLIGGLILGALLWPVLRRLAQALPHLRMEPKIQARGPRALMGTFIGFLALFALEGGCASDAYIRTLDEYSMRGWMPGYACPWAFADRNKGQEYRLLNQLKAFHDNPPAVSIDRDPFAFPASSSMNDLMLQTPLIAMSLSVLFAFAWFLWAATMALGAGRSGAVFRQDCAAARQLSTAAMNTTLTLMLALGARFALCDFFLPLLRGRQTTFPQRSLHSSADVKTVTLRLRDWCGVHGYQIPSYQHYLFSTVPKEERIGAAAAYRIWDDDVCQRWQWAWGTFVLCRPLLYVEYFGSDKPAETVIRIEANPTDRNAEAAVMAEVDNLAAAMGENRIASDCTCQHPYSL